MITAEEMKAIEDDHDYWKQLADVLGWTLHGFTYRTFAHYRTDKQAGYITMSGQQRDDIMNAIIFGRTFS